MEAQEQLAPKKRKKAAAQPSAETPVEHQEELALPKDACECVEHERAPVCKAPVSLFRVIKPFRMRLSGMPGVLGPIIDVNEGDIVTSLEIKAELRNLGPDYYEVL